MEHLGHDHALTSPGTIDALRALTIAANAASPGHNPQHAIQDILSKLTHQSSIEQDPYQSRTDSRPIYHGSRIELPAFLRAVSDKLTKNVTLFQFAVNGYFSHPTNGKTVVPNLGMAHAIDHGVHRHASKRPYDIIHPAPLDPPADPSAKRAAASTPTSAAWTFSHDTYMLSAPLIAQRDHELFNFVTQYFHGQAVIDAYKTMSGYSGRALLAKLRLENETHMSPEMIAVLCQDLDKILDTTQPIRTRPALTAHVHAVQRATIAIPPAHRPTTVQVTTRLVNAVTGGDHGLARSVQDAFHRAGTDRTDIQSVYLGLCTFIDDMHAVELFANGRTTLAPRPPPAAPAPAHQSADAPASPTADPIAKLAAAIAVALQTAGYTPPPHAEPSHDKPAPLMDEPLASAAFALTASAPPAPTPQQLADTASAAALLAPLPPWPH